MASEDHIVQQKTLSFKTLSKYNSEEVANFVAKNSTKFQHADQQNKTRLYSIINLMIIPTLKSQWSFGLYEKNKLVGVYLQLDVLDYLNICKIIGLQSVSQIFGLKNFSEYVQNKLANVQRGDYLMNIFNQVEDLRSSSSCRKQISLIYQGLYLCKLGGWKNIIFPTYNPFPFLKINANVVDQAQYNAGQNIINNIGSQQLKLRTETDNELFQYTEEKKGQFTGVNSSQIKQKRYLMQIQMKNLIFSVSPFRQMYSKL